MDRKLVFLVGCGRSGTTWLQLLLAQHPSVATLEETHLFPECISPMLARCRKDRQSRRKIGLSVLMDEQQLRELFRKFALDVLGTALADKPEASIILEKTPLHLEFGEDILELFPDAHFIHIVRDPRAVVASLINAGETWGGGWAPRAVEKGARMWRDAVVRGRRLKDLTTRYTEVSYEILFQSTEGELRRVLAEIGIETTAELCRNAALACSAGNIKAGTNKVWAPRSISANLGSLVRRAEIDGWRRELSRSQIRMIEHVTRSALEDFGYTAEVATTDAGQVRLQLDRALDAARRFTRGIARRLSLLPTAR